MTRPEATLARLIAADEVRHRLLGAVAGLGLPDCWIGAGFVRSAVWDHGHGRPPGPTWDDIDVIWFDRDQGGPEVDAAIERRLARLEPSVNWSVKNQARMHRRNNDTPYRSAEDAMSRWPETATAVALRVNGRAIDIIAPYGLDDLFSLLIRPTPAFVGAKRPVFLERVRGKRWLERWPRLVVTE